MNGIVSIPDTSAELSRLVNVFMAELLRYDTAEMIHLLKREDLSMPRMAALDFVERQGSTSISEISVYLNLSLGNTSTLVDKLVCHNFVTRVEDVHDRRHKLVRLTEKGQVLVQEVRAARVDRVVHHLLHLPPELLDRLLAVLHDVQAQLPPSNTASSTEHR